ncbi:MAG: hypothetical protein RML36_10455 [Anaerolineae bacterium]|nr:hypothetical protein [Anaerolineae bacterium]MDW8099888.1 hypothetical protein [Anaerolineae bacterium]
MLHWFLVIGAVLCAVQAIRAARLLISALWLAGTSALVALILYGMGAHEVAVIELSVGAGLVTVLFVFAINVAGEEAIPMRSLVPQPLAWGLVLLSLFLLAGLAFPWTGTVAPMAELSFAHMLWQARSLDVLVQIALIFAGVLGILGLLAETPVWTRERAAQPESSIGSSLSPSSKLRPSGSNGHQTTAAELPVRSQEVHS